MNICLFGKRGAGKTTWIKKYINQSYCPCIIIDTLNEYHNEAVYMPITNEINFDKFKVRFIPETDVEFDIICSIFHYQRFNTPVNFIVSEIDFWSNSNYIPYYLLNCIRYSRHYNLNVICDVRNPIELNRKISALADKFIIFRITEPRYLDYFKGYDNDLPNRIKKLKKYEYIDYNLLTF